ncbi:beta-1,4-D-glucan cellobiohydrolase [Rhizoctonia solani]|uniref:cellulose 1,4-beta-cellobiosidase (non-reducing end) n=1 Tax=Rhizoctonia solani TaxID=456999 RepID=A0A8H8P2P4_9AGAM|nr:beta-1,4-D-glucan cellobiohydrolase [Rhizoctonia solani]QRW24065.1 beta-1,4-D-glucan cellobiohydrolase [Rhizoctonia solani]
MYCTLALISLYLAAVRASRSAHPSLRSIRLFPGPSAPSPAAASPSLKARSCSTLTGAGFMERPVTPTATPARPGTRHSAPTVQHALRTALEGADYPGTYGITTSGDALTLKFVTQSANKNVGSRVYLMASDDTKYEMFKLKNQEFTFDVDVSKLPCGLNGALYFVEMDADGGTARFPNNKAGAKYGTGYCDAQCARDIKFINGEGNVVDWTGSTTDPNSGKGKYGSCCNEMDIWEANSIANAYTPHPCTPTGQARCDSTTSQCADYCDQPGCDWNPFRMGDKNLYGPGKVVDTNKKITVVTQFITNDNTANGKLVEIRRLYVQNGQVTQNTKSTISGLTQYDSITDQFCAAQKTVFQDTNAYAQHGGMATMDKSFQNGHVLVMSLWDDHAAHMLWLDSNYPLDRPATQVGVPRGTCATTSGDPKDVEAQSPNASVTFSNIKFGDIGTTYGTGSTPTNPAPPTTTTTTASNPSPTSPSGSAPLYGQCGGEGWTGPTTCASDSSVADCMSPESQGRTLPYKELDSSNWLPVINEFQVLIESDESVYHGFTEMFQQARDLPGVSSARDYKEMLQGINYAIQRAPRYERGLGEYAAFGIYCILDKVMCTPAGLATLANPLVNLQFSKIFDVWADFLSSPMSRLVLTDDTGGWFGPMALEDMPNFFETYLCDPNAPYCGFQSWDDYFTRQLRPGARPVECLEDNGVINSACESTVYCISNNVKERDSFWLKGQPYSLRDMFHDDPFTNLFVGGTIIQCYLRAFDYHRWHSPTNGRVIKTRMIPGVYFSQSPQVTNGSRIDPITSQQFLTAVSTRVLVFIESDNRHIGLMCFMAVGMAEISTCDLQVKPGDRVTKGQDIGMFHFGGSTCCMLFRPSVRIDFDCIVGDSITVNSIIGMISI